MRHTVVVDKRHIEEAVVCTENFIRLTDDWLTLASTVMIAPIRLALAIVASQFKAPAQLEAENAAHRQQLVALRRSLPGCVKLSNDDRTFLAWLYRLFPSVGPALVLVCPETPTSSRPFSPATGRSG